MIFKYFCYDRGNIETNPDVSVILILFLCFREDICKTSYDNLLNILAISVPANLQSNIKG